MKNTFYLGLSLAGTVSAGTYTAGSLIELNSWLSAWRKAVRENKPTKLKAINKAGPYNIGDEIEILPNEIPKHNVKIKTLTGASGGGVSAALMLVGLAKNDLEKYLHQSWQSFSIDQMLQTGDIDAADAKVYSLLNVLPIDNIARMLTDIVWDAEDHFKDIDYLEDVVDLYQTLSSYEPISYTLVNFENKSQSAFKNHFDYIRFGLSVRNGANPEPNPKTPFLHPLKINAGGRLKDDDSWVRLVESSPATGAFPIGLRPRQVWRSRKEYDYKFFYLNYTMNNPKVDYADLKPIWKDGKDPFQMAYFDGGTFNREPHDLARAALINYLQSIGALPEGKSAELPNKGENVFASVILVDPFPNKPEPIVPGELELPTLVKQPGLLIGALMEQGRFHIDWVEKTTNEDYYSRFLISPQRPVASKCKDPYYLTAEPFSAFNGFMDDKFRSHDYRLGHYNTSKFLTDSFMVPITNATVTYSNNISRETRDKYEALGWYRNENGKEFAQIIPRFYEINDANSVLPEWPSIDRERWEDIRDLMLDRSSAVIKRTLKTNSVMNWLLWQLKAKGLMNELLDKMEKTLECAQLLK